MTPLRLGRSAGFSLIEAVVAMALIAVLGATLFSWVASSVSALARAEQAANEDVARRNVLAYVQTLNPMQRPQGSEDWGNLKIEWQSRPIEDPRDQIGYPGGIGLYRVALYDLTVSASRTNPVEPWFELRLVQIGWHRQRESSVPF